MTSREKGRKEMGKHVTISNDYRVMQFYDDGGIKKELTLDDPVYAMAMDKMVKSFNDSCLEQYLDDGEAVHKLGCTIKEKIKSIRMKRVVRNGAPYIQITTETYPRRLRLTQKVRDFLDDYLSSQFCDGWGEGFFYPMSFESTDGTKLAVE